MKFPHCRFVVSCLAIGLFACAPVAIPPAHTPEQQQEDYDRERYQAKIRFDPAVPQSMSGFVRLGRVSSMAMGSDGALMSGGNARDLDAILDAVNEFTEIEAEFTGDLTYGHPALLDLPIVIPQSAPNEAELEQMARYILAGGFIFDISLGLERYREGLEKYGGLVWGRDAWVERLPDNHPLFSAYFSIVGGLPEIRATQTSAGQSKGAARPMRGLFVNGRLAGVAFRALASPPLPGTTFESAESFQDGGSDEEALRASLERRSDPRLRQMLVNIVVFALTQEGSIAQQVVAE